MQPYYVPSAPVTALNEIKKSRFITLLAHTRGAEAAKAFIRQAQVSYPNARHYCWAYVAGPPQDSLQLGFSDDGEPSGTAGKPMLAQLQGCGLGEITAVVVRYFGGVKLGTGGLVRAYGGGVQQALKLVIPLEIIPQGEFVLACDYQQQAWVEMAVKQAGGRIINSDYGQSVILRVAVPRARVAEADEKLRDLSHGALQLPPVSQ